MKLVRNVHALCAIIAGFAITFAVLGFLRAAIVAIALVLILVAWSLDLIRSALPETENRR